MIEEVIIKQFKLLMVEYVEEPCQRIMEEWSALFSKNLHVQFPNNRVDFSEIPELPSTSLPQSRTFTHELMFGMSQRERFKTQAWEAMLGIVKKQVDERFQVLFNKIESDLESMKNARDSDKFFQRTNILATCNGLRHFGLPIIMQMHLQRDEMEEVKREVAQYLNQPQVKNNLKRLLVVTTLEKKSLIRNGKSTEHD
jgi:hypothetical protein